MTELELLLLVARYTRWCLYHNMSLEPGSTRFCNLWDLIQASLGVADPCPQVPLQEVVDWIVDDMRATLGKSVCGEEEP